MSSTNRPGLLVPLPIETSFDHDYFYPMDDLENFRNWKCFRNSIIIFNTKGAIVVDDAGLQQFVLREKLSQSEFIDLLLSKRSGITGKQQAELKDAIHHSMT